jgi:hypothetical protein
LLSDRRHSLRFILWTLLAVWVTASLAAGGTYLAIRLDASGEAHYRGRDYNDAERCVPSPARGTLEAINGFTPLTAGESALVIRTAGVGYPRTIYVWRSDRGCIREWSIERRD